MSYQDFSQELAFAMRRGDKSDIPEVQQAAQRIRTEMDAKVKRMQELGILTDDLKLSTASSYLSRRYNIDKMIAEKPKFIAITENYLRKEFPNADADGIPTKDGTTISVSEKAGEIFDHIRGLGDDQLEITSITQGMHKGTSFTKERVFDIPDVDIEEFLLSDGMGISMGYLAKADRAIRFKEFLDNQGYDSIADLKKAVRDEHDDLNLRKVDKVDGKEVVIQEPANLSEADLKKQLQLIDQQTAIMLGHFGPSNNPALDDSLRVLRGYQVTRLLGGMTISAISDAAMPIFKHGIPATIRDGYGATLRSLSTSKMAKDEWLDYNIGNELMKNDMLKALIDPDFSVKVGETKIQKFVNQGLDVFGKVSLMSYWNRAHRRMAAHMSSARTARSILAAADGKATQADIERLATLNIDKSQYEMIALQLRGDANRKGNMQEIDGSIITNIDKWDNQQAKDLFGAAVVKDVNSTILQPGRGDIPFGIQSSEFAKTIAQFKSFGFAASNKILLSSLNRRDKNVLIGLTALIGMGMVTFAAKQLAAGKAPPNFEENYDQYILEGISRSGVGGLIGDASFLFVPGLSSSRFASYNTLQALTGPGFGQLADISDIANRLGKAAVDGRAPTASDRKKMWRMLPLNTFPPIRLMFDKLNND
jgi:hypothetical protein